MNWEQYWQPGDLLSISNRLLEQGDRTAIQPHFLREVLHVLLEYTRSDTARLVYIEGERRFRCELTHDQSRPFRYEETPRIHDLDGGIIWGSGEDHVLEQLCRDIIDGSESVFASWLTSTGSFWSEDIRSHPETGLVFKEHANTLGISAAAESRSIAIIPIEAFGKRIGLLQLDSTRKGLFTERAVESYQNLAQTLGLALAHRRVQLALGERVKELTCLYNLLKLVTNPQLTLDDLLLMVIKILPPAWLYPEITVVRLELDDKLFTTPNYRPPVQHLAADIFVRGACRGIIEVGYTWNKPVLDEGPFLIEERHLIDAIARELSVIIEQKHDEAERIALQSQLRQADRLATIGQLAAGISHELNEPLANILGFAQLLIQEKTLTPQSRQDVDRIISATLRARDIIRTLLLFARETPPAKSAANVNALIVEAMGYLENRCAKEGITVEYGLEKDLSLITADHGQIHQALTNLLVNAMQAMPEGGTLRIGTAARDGMVDVTIADTGIGINPEIMGKIFDPFFTTKDIDRGTGLGLSIVHGIITSHGGSIDVQSTPGKGSVFSLHLPVTETTTAQEV
jgi:signal transduction histidine kinase